MKDMMKILKRRVKNVNTIGIQLDIAPSGIMKAILNYYLSDNLIQVIRWIE